MNLSIKASFRYIAFVLMYAVMSSYAFAEPAGFMILQKGKVKVVNRYTEKVHDQINTKITIFEMDELHADEDARGEVYLSVKNDVIHLYSNSFLKVEQANEKKSSISLPLGKARFVVSSSKGQRRSSKRFVVKTSNAVIGVKGTDFLIQTDGSETNVMTVEGVVQLSNSVDLTKTVDIPQNTAANTVRSTPPTIPVKVSPGAQQDIIKQDKPEKWSGVTFSKKVVTSKTSSTKKTTSTKKSDGAKAKSDQNDGKKETGDKQDAGQSTDNKKDENQDENQLKESEQKDDDGNSPVDEESAVIDEEDSGELVSGEDEENPVEEENTDLEAGSDAPVESVDDAALDVPDDLSEQITVIDQIVEDTSSTVDDVQTIVDDVIADETEKAIQFIIQYD
ncbi:MAG: FecR family protein [Deltaproteobacteria bacterium]|nr:FecR family protein [Deltaproteobacteria bacterium]